MNFRSRFLGSGQRSEGKADNAQVLADPRALRGDSDAHATAVLKFLNETGLFDRDLYAKSYPDVARSGLDPLHHYVRVGIHAGRQFTSQQTIARLWRDVLRAEPASQAVEPLANPEHYRIGIYTSSLGNFFMKEMAEIIAGGFAEARVTSVLCDENAKAQRDLTHHIVIAPHEFFVLGEGRRWATDEFVSRAILFATEQIQTPWFARSLLFLLRAKAVADMNEQNAAILRKAGVRAAAVQPGFTPEFKPFAAGVTGTTSPVLNGLEAAFHQFDTASDVFAHRPLDVVFLGHHSPRREKLLANYATTFSELKNFIYYSRTTAPLASQHNPMASSHVTAALLRRAKVLLNLHRDEYTYFEWWRLMQAFWNKAVVVTEPCFPHSTFKAGVHYFEEAPRHIHHLVAWLAQTSDGRAKAEDVRRRAFDDLVERSSAKSAALALLRLGGA